MTGRYVVNARVPSKTNHHHHDEDDNVRGSYAAVLCTGSPLYARDWPHHSWLRFASAIIISVGRTCIHTFVVVVVVVVVFFAAHSSSRTRRDSVVAA